MRRFLAFILGMIFGIVFLLLAIGGAIVFAVTMVHPEHIASGTEPYLGDFSSMSIYEMAKSIQELYKSKIGIADENGNYYTVGDFANNYHIEALKSLPEDVLGIPVFEFANGDDGVSRTLKQIKVSALPSILNMFSSEDNASGIISDEAITKLSAYSLEDLLDENKGINYVFENVLFAEMLPSMFPVKGTDNDLMWALGQTRIGKLLSGMSGSDNILLQVKENGAMEELGKLPLSTIAGEDNKLISVLGADATISDLISDTGELNVNGLLDTLTLGELLDNHRIEIADISEYAELIKDADNKNIVMVKSDNGNNEYIKNVNDIYYKADLDCEEDHAHTEECYKVLWYDSNDELAKGITTNFNDITIDNLNAETINSTINNTRLGDILDTSSNQILSELSDIKVGSLGEEMNKIYIGTAMNRYRQKYQFANQTFVPNTNNTVANIASGYIKTDDGKKWYKAKLTCMEEHTHEAKCYEYIWYTDTNYTTEVSGISGAFVNATLDNINDVIDGLTLRKLGIKGNNIIDAVQDVKINELGTAINDIKMGTVLGYERGDKISDELTCENNSHTHTENCYDYIWKNKDNGNQIKGLNGKMSNMTVSDLSGGTGISKITDTLTIGDLIDSNMMKLGETEDVKRNNEYKFAIICCDNGNAIEKHSFTKNGITYNCALQGYFAYKASQNSNITAREYWLLTHGQISENAPDSEVDAAEMNLSTALRDHRDVWKQMTLSDFITTMLSAIN